MTNLAFRKFLILVLITVCLFGCDQALDVSNDIIGDSPDLDSPGTLPTSEEVPVGTEEELSDPVNQTPGTEESSDDIEELLATIEVLGTEIEKLDTGLADDDNDQTVVDTGLADDDDDQTVVDTGLADDDDDDQTVVDTGLADDDDDMDEPEGLNIGDEVVAQNTMGGDLNGLLVREKAGVQNMRIGGVFDGATGTITDGPEYEDNYTWWKVRWNSSNSVVCDKNPCEGWSVEFFRGSRLLAER